MAETTKVRASVLHGSKDLRLESIPLPPPAPTELQIAIRSTTLCGSDLHYYAHYRNGDILVQEPLALGHESSGIVVAVGKAAGEDGGWKVGERVALEVGQPCETCELCRGGRYNLCPQMRFRSSAKSSPHAWGTLVDRVNHPAKWCHRLPASVPYAQAALVEPLSVAIHATRRAIRNGALAPAASVAVFGAGAVGLLVGAMAKLAGASRVVITDINAGRVDFAIREGFATHGYVVSTDGPRPTEIADKLAAAQSTAAALSATISSSSTTTSFTGFDAVFECTGMEACVQAGIYSARPGGALVLVGMGVPIQTLPISAAALREVDILGGFRYANTYRQGIDVVAAGKIPALEKLVTHRFFGIGAVKEAFEMAGRQTDEEGRLVIKVECVFEGKEGEGEEAKL